MVALLLLLVAAVDVVQVDEVLQGSGLGRPSWERC